MQQRADDRRAFTVLGVVWLLQIILFAYVANDVVSVSVDELTDIPRDAMQASLRTDAASAAVLGSLPMYGAPVLIILGALMGAGDERSGILRLVLSRVPERTSILARRGAAMPGGVPDAPVAAVMMFVVSDVDTARGFAFGGMAGVVGAVIAAVRSTTTERKAVFAAGGVLLLIASSTMFGLSFS